MKYATSDLLIATTLLAKGFVLQNIIPVSAKRVEFYFQDSERLKTVIDAFWDEKIRIEPQAFFACMKQLKNRLHSTLRSA